MGTKLSLVIIVVGIMVTCVHLHEPEVEIPAHEVNNTTEIRRNFRNLLDSIRKRDTNGTRTYRNFLEQETAREREEFHSVKKEMAVRQQNRDDRVTNFGKMMFKRETGMISSKKPAGPGNGAVTSGELTLEEKARRYDEMKPKYDEMKEIIENFVDPHIANAPPRIRMAVKQEVDEMNTLEGFLKRPRKVPKLFSVPFVSFTKTITSGVSPGGKHPGIPIAYRPALDPYLWQTYYQVKYVYCSGAEKYYKKQDVLILDLEKTTYCDPWIIRVEDSRRELRTPMPLKQGGYFGDAFLLSQSERTKLCTLLHKSNEHLESEVCPE